MRIEVFTYKNDRDHRVWGYIAPVDYVEREPIFYELPSHEGLLISELYPEMMVFFVVNENNVYRCSPVKGLKYYEVKRYDRD